MTAKQNTNSTATFENMPELEVGTVLVANLGWSMVLPTFYRIVARTESSIWTKEIRSIASASDEYGTSGTKVADLTAAPASAHPSRVATTPPSMGTTPACGTASPACMITWTKSPK